MGQIFRFSNRKVAPFRDIHGPSQKLPFAQRLEATLCGSSLALGRTHAHDPLRTFRNDALNVRKLPDSRPSPFDLGQLDCTR
jgi:hypothetical protein